MPRGDGADGRQPIARRQISFLTEDGRRLVGVLRRPPGQLSAAAVLHGATGAPQTAYGAFADWLAETQGVASLTYDYRDFGASQAGPLRNSHATMLDWGVRDQNAALDETLRLFGGEAPVWVIGHSLGALFLEQQRQIHRVSRVIAVCSGRAHWRDHPLRFAPAVAAFWFFVGPIATAAMGYLPGRRIGFGADLPAGVYWQWRRWCLSQDFADGDLAKAGWDACGDISGLPIRFVAAADDVMIPPETVWRFMSHHQGARWDQLLLRPVEIGAGPIGHLSVFKPRNAAAWPALVAPFRHDRM